MTSRELLADDPLWMPILKTVVLFLFLVVMTLIMIWAERRVVGRMQHRSGPNRTGPFGLLQSLADGIKLALKEDIVPGGADKPVFLIAPVLATVPAFLSWAVIPFGGEVTIFGEKTALQLADFEVSTLFILAVASVGIYGIVLSGWASNSTYPLLGGLRSSAQMISYEVAMSLSFVAVFLYAGGLSTSGIVEAQGQRLWFVIPLLPSFVIYTIAMVGETNRAPFDLPEAEGELVGGFHTEYSSLRFALFFLAEYVNMVTVSGLATTLFLGGWHSPPPISTIWPGSNEGFWPVLWFVGKMMVFLFVFIWLRGSLPRMRYDQFMKLGWKVLIPVSIAWIVLVATVQALTNQGTSRPVTVLVVGGLLLILLAIGYAVLNERDLAREAEAVAEEERLSVWDEFGGGFPVPPIPGQAIAPTPVGPTWVSEAVASTVGAPALDQGAHEQRTETLEA